MKKIILFIILLGVCPKIYSQYIHHIKADSVLIHNNSCNAELVLLNSTRSSAGAFLQNIGNGRTQFKYAIDSTWMVNDSLYLRRGDTTFAFVLQGNNNWEAITDKPNGGNYIWNQSGAAQSANFWIAGSGKMGDLSVSSLATSSIAPSTSGVTKMVVTDAAGLLSFAELPALYTFSNGLNNNGGLVSLGGDLSGYSSIRFTGANPSSNFIVFGDDVNWANYTFLDRSHFQSYYVANNLHYVFEAGSASGLGGNISGIKMDIAHSLNTFDRNRFGTAVFASGRSGFQMQIGYDNSSTNTLTFINWLQDGLVGIQDMDKGFLKLGKPSRSPVGTIADLDGTIYYDPITNQYSGKRNGEWRNFLMTGDVGGNSIAIPTGRIAYGTDNSLTSDANFTWDGKTLTVASFGNSGYGISFHTSYNALSNPYNCSITTEWIPTSGRSSTSAFGLSVNAVDGIQFVVNNNTNASNPAMLIAGYGTNAGQVAIGTTSFVGTEKLRVNGSIRSQGLIVASLPTYNDDSAAAAAGLMQGEVYKTPAGILMIKL